MAQREDDRYESYEGFLRGVIKAYWDSSSRRRVNFISLLLASRQTWSVAWEGARAPGSGKRILTGAAGAAAVAILIRTLLGGPVGILLTGASIASLVALYVKHHRRIWARARSYEHLIGDYRAKFDEVRREHADGALREEQRDLMLDGLLSRFLVDLDEVEDTLDEDEYEDEEGETGAREESSDFERHAERRRAEERDAGQAETLDDETDPPDGAD